MLTKCNNYSSDWGSTA